MTDHQKKPQGASGPIQMSPSIEWKKITFPSQKDECERFIAGLFVGGFKRWVAMESEPSLAPFGEPEQNDENNLDFTIGTALGVKLMELAEFAPLVEHGPTFSQAPTSVSPPEKADLAEKLIRKKSARQGGSERFLVIYATEHGFWLDPLTIEHLRRKFVDNPPNFDRVYYVSVHDREIGSVSEIYPGSPHHYFGERTNEQLTKLNVTLPHPSEIVATGGVVKFNRPASACIRLTLPALTQSTFLNYQGLLKLP